MGAYPHLRQVGPMIFLSGIGPRNPDSKTVPGLELDDEGEVISYDFSKQCHSIFHNLKTILEDYGSSLEDIVDVTVFLTNMKKDFSI